MKKSIVSVLMFAGMFTYAQVTTSIISGNVKDGSSKPVAGSTVVLVHEPSGTRYVAKTNSKGEYTLPNVRVGGPYKITVTAAGIGETEQTDIYTSLGTNSTVDVVLSKASATKSIDEVVIRSTKNPIINSKATGAATTIGREALNRTPTVGRTVNDITKYNPYSNGRSFSGQDSRLNNFTIDGAVFNNGFGLGSQAQAGGRTGSGAISLDALEELQINIAPYDVKQSGFAGAAINAVTRSGNNNFSGSYFTFFNSDGLIGKKPYGTKISPSFSNTTNGFRLSGPILKNKLFFFVNGEFTEGTSPALDWVAARPGASGNISRTTYADLLDLKNFMMQKLNYDLGEIDGYNKESYSRKYLARLDWNINDNHKLTLRYSHHDSESDQIVNNSNSSNTAGNGNRQNRSNAISGQNTGYGIMDNTRSYVAELNSKISDKVSNQLIATYNKQIEDRSYKTPGIFPTIDILKDGQTYTSLGMDPFTPNNKLDYSTLNITNNTSILLGKHNITAGLSYERFVSNNLFFYASNGVWTFNSIADFKQAVNDYLANPNATTSSVAINRFNYRYTMLPNGQLPWQTLKVNTYSAYVQDSYKPVNNLSLYLGARLDYIDVENTSKDYANPYVAGLTFKLPDGSDYKVNTASMPKGRLYVSPRFGFNYDVFNNKSTQLRGGTGIFLSRMPYVLISNQLGNNGVNIGLINATPTGVGPNNSSLYPFTLDPTRYTPKNIDPTTLRGYNVNYGDPNLKFPQVWRSSLGIDQKLPFGGLIATVEGIYNKNINALHYIDVNLKAPNGNFTGSGDNRPTFPALNPNTGTITSGNRMINTGVGNVFVLTNNNKGYSYSLTGKIEKPLTNIWGGFVGYTYSKTKDLSSVGSTVNANTPTVTGQNYLTTGYSDADLRHRIVGNLSLKLDYGSRIFGGATTITLGFVSSSGYNYSYTIGNDMNGDGQINDLMYIPKNASDIKFVPYSTGSGANATTFSAAQQSDAFEQFINSSKYLKENRGKFSERGGAVLPWFNRVDLGIEQDITGRISHTAKPNTIKFRIDILNFGNLLNKKWGVTQIATNTQPLTYKGVDAVTKQPVYNLFAPNDANGKPQLLNNAFTRSATISDVFQIQIGFRYTFN